MNHQNHAPSSTLACALTVSTAAITMLPSLASSVFGSRPFPLMVVVSCALFHLETILVACEITARISLVWTRFVPVVSNRLSPLLISGYNKDTTPAVQTAGGILSNNS
ncbi:hypothetical protein COCC4DRAFT_34620 [Bipolaris maydis ATCC 48331]|uniref:Uncharacterized protein n=2 Tax=Cochliobolus heterostrophus TaxID=5016 RepID=M2U5K4_COCH5|nr:uncharacterized protein COCC4DRAFT_34620 [Bipolaris maydis ATCC 48331]EMD93814.1 hypothetical protein COCHEDRAFT_1020679 [Bipolaris maydis C5]KAJ5028089.1 hypothetical protein J3E73DRAFT_298225 [Bipolaris maydis]ENH99890.1 hypothetical protein COCC4DRAFT_34620 [Bipolaris maydis ATCC 48331]KAJ5062862.1 hypothetical protein J3E74DRAFT_325131 [Bipolaris maydis]KAJ6199135.1 hypothetical protein J3E72DRAFT_312083 [Bipolaris maydis]